MRFLLCAGALALAAAGGVAAWRFKGHVRIALMQAGIAPQRTVAHRTVEESQMGGDIYVHGGSSSIGCLAIGDDAIEEVFCLLAQVREREIWIAPCDLRRVAPPRTGDAWLDDLYARLHARLTAR